MRFPWVCSLVLALCSCNGDCVAIAGPAFVVDVTDARNGALLAAGATLIAYGAAGADSVSYPDPSDLCVPLPLLKGAFPLARIPLRSDEMDT